MDGRSRTEAAHETGFADSAHLSRTFRQMFGISPAMLIREKRWSIKEICSGVFGLVPLDSHSVYIYCSLGPSNFKSPPVLSAHQS
jgi:AraC-like DNA-binding protein